MRKSFERNFFAIGLFLLLTNIAHSQNPDIVKFTYTGTEVKTLIEPESCSYKKGNFDVSIKPISTERASLDYLKSKRATGKFNFRTSDFDLEEYKLKKSFWDSEARRSNYSVLADGIIQLYNDQTLTRQEYLNAVELLKEHFTIPDQNASQVTSSPFFINGRNYFLLELTITNNSPENDFFEPTIKLFSDSTIHNNLTYFELREILLAANEYSIDIDLFLKNHYLKEKILVPGNSTVKLYVTYNPILDLNNSKFTIIIDEKENHEFQTSIETTEFKDSKEFFDIDINLYQSGEIFTLSESASDILFLINTAPIGSFISGRTLYVPINQSSGPIRIMVFGAEYNDFLFSEFEKPLSEIINLEKKKVKSITIGIKEIKLNE